MNGLFHVRFYYIYVKEQQELWRGDEAGLEEVNYDSRTEWVLRKLYTTQTAVKQLVAPSCNRDAVIKTKSMLSCRHKRNCLTLLQGRRCKKDLNVLPIQLNYVAAFSVRLMSFYANVLVALKVLFVQKSYTIHTDGSFIATIQTILSCWFNLLAPAFYI